MAVQQDSELDSTPLIHAVDAQECPPESQCNAESSKEDSPYPSPRSRHHEEMSTTHEQYVQRLEDAFALASRSPGNVLDSRLQSMVEAMGHAAGISVWFTSSPLSAATTTIFWKAMLFSVALMNSAVLLHYVISLSGTTSAHTYYRLSAIPVHLDLQNASVGLSWNGIPLPLSSVRNGQSSDQLLLETDEPQLVNGWYLELLDRADAGDLQQIQLSHSDDTTSWTTLSPPWGWDFYSIPRSQPLGTAPPATISPGPAHSMERVKPMQWFNGGWMWIYLMDSRVSTSFIVGPLMCRIIGTSGASLGLHFALVNRARRSIQSVAGYLALQTFFFGIAVLLCPVPSRRFSYFAEVIVNASIGLVIWHERYFVRCLPATTIAWAVVWVMTGEIVPALMFMVAGTLLILLWGGRMWTFRQSRRRILPDLERYQQLWAELTSDPAIEAEIINLKEAVERLGLPENNSKPRHLTPGLGGRGESYEAKAPRRLGSTFCIFVNQPVTSLDQLYVQAEMLSVSLRRKVWSLARASNGALRSIRCGEESGTSQLDCDYVQDPVEVRWAPVKQPYRAIQKVLRSYAGDVSRLVDICREQIVFDSIADIRRCLEAAEQDRSLCILRIKNRLDPAYDAELSAGYRDVAVNLRISTEETRRLCIDQHVCELQLLPRCYANLKSIAGHKRYVQYRDERAE